uniref:Kazal-like domain-containing protein n=1 Tax=Hucho hucho TaxID=62062 RepID=A0A4W5NAR4_9TELE
SAQQYLASRNVHPLIKTWTIGRLCCNCCRRAGQVQGRQNISFTQHRVTLFHRQTDAPPLYDNATASPGSKPTADLEHGTSQIIQKQRRYKDYIVLLELQSVTGPIPIILSVEFDLIWPDHMNMVGKTILLVCLAVIFSAADAEDRSTLYRRPSCGDMSLTQACPLNYSPVCGNDGNTYPNECSLCVHRMETNADILIVKDGSC